MLNAILLVLIMGGLITFSYLSMTTGGFNFLVIPPLLLLFLLCILVAYGQVTRFMRTPRFQSDTGVWGAVVSGVNEYDNDEIGYYVAVESGDAPEELKKSPGIFKSYTGFMSGATIIEVIGKRHMFEWIDPKIAEVPEPVLRFRGNLQGVDLTGRDKEQNALLIREYNDLIGQLIEQVHRARTISHAASQEQNELYKDVIHKFSIILRQFNRKDRFIQQSQVGDSKGGEEG